MNRNQEITINGLHPFETGGRDSCAKRYTYLTSKYVFLLVFLRSEPAMKRSHQMIGLPFVVTPLLNLAPCFPPHVFVVCVCVCVGCVNFW